MPVEQAALNERALTRPGPVLRAPESMVNEDVMKQYVRIFWVVAGTVVLAGSVAAIAAGSQACGGGGGPRATEPPIPSAAPSATATVPLNDLDAPLPQGVDDVIRTFVAQQGGEYVGRCADWEEKQLPVERAFCHLRVQRPGGAVLRVDVGVVASDYVFRLTLEQQESGQWVLRSIEKPGGT